MRRFVVSSLVLTVVVVAGLAAVSSVRLSAQEATPAGEPNLIVGQLAPIGQTFEVIPGIDLQFLNEGESTQAPGQHLVLYRVVFRGGEIPFHTHPGTTVLTVEEGTFSWTLLAGTVWVTRPGQEPEEVTEPGTELILSQGEGLAYNVEVVHTARAAGDEATTVLVASIFETGQPFVTVTNEEGTPET